MFPTGYRRSNLRQLRYGAIVLLLLVGVVSHHSGPTYSLIRYGYLALVLGLVVARLRGRRGGFATRASAPAPVVGDNVHEGSYGVADRFPDQEADVERYWDGSSWTARRRFDGANWIEESKPPSS